MMNERIQKDFPILKQQDAQGIPFTYLDNAATTQKPLSVIQTIQDYYSQYNANVYRSIHRWGEESTRRLEEARKKVAKFIGCENSKELIFTSGTTESINLLANSLGNTFSEGDEIILSIMEHHSNIVPWQMLAKRKGIKLKYINLTPNGEIDRNHLKTLWSKRTKLLSITHMSNVLGTINDASSLIQEAHSHNALVLLDGAQSVPHMPIKVKELDVDFLVFSGHKMCGPTGIGALYGKEELLNSIDAWQGGGEMIRTVTIDGSDWDGLPHKFEAGTPNIAGAIGLGAAVDYLNDLGMDNIFQKEQELTKALIQGLSNIEGITIYGSPSHRGGIAAFTYKNYHPHDLTQYLDSCNLALRAGHHCAHPLAHYLGIKASVRASLYFYNSFEDIDKLCAALQEAGDHIF